MRVALACVLLLGFLTVPTVAAENSATVVMAMQSPSEIEMTAEATIEGEDAKELRMQIDQFGNNDGEVQQSEVDTLEDFFRSFMDGNEDAGEDIGGDFTIDGNGPKSFSLDALDVKDATGAVDSDQPVKMIMEATMMFDVAAGDSHTIKLGAFEADESEGDEQGDFFDGIKSAKFRAAPGYIFSSTEGLPSGAKVSGDKKEIEFAGALGQGSTSDMTIMMTKGGGGVGGGVSPGLGPVAILAVALVLLWAGRSRFERL